MILQETYAPAIATGGGLAMIFTDVVSCNVINWDLITSNLTRSGYYVQVVFLGSSGKIDLQNTNVFFRQLQLRTSQK